MSNDKEIESYIEKAEKMKIKEEKYAEKTRKESLVEAKERAKEMTMDTSEYDFYRGMNPDQHGKIWFIFLLIFIFGTELIFFINVLQDHPNNYLYLAPIAFGILWALRHVYSWAYTYITFSDYKSWRTHLPFKLEGWGKLACTDRDEFSAFNWRVRCSVKINFKGDYLAQQKATDAICYLFTTKANYQFYNIGGASVAGYAEDPRIYWTYADGVLSGSSNIKVVWEIYCFVKNELSLLSRKFDIIESVEIEADNKEASIKPRMRLYSR